jgi:hypothetical protein
VRYAYYARLDARGRAVYRKSDAHASIELPSARTLRPLVTELAAALATAERLRVERAAQALTSGLLARLSVPEVRVKVHATRPQLRDGELHGYYELGTRRAKPVIRLWMRTSANRRVVAFRTFLRTLLHEVCHHLDYELLELADSFHTEGFFKRESSLFRQLVPPRVRN